MQQVERPTETRWTERHGVRRRAWAGALIALAVPGAGLAASPQPAVAATVTATATATCEDFRGAVHGLDVRTERLTFALDAPPATVVEGQTVTFENLTVDGIDPYSIVVGEQFAQVAGWATGMSPLVPTAGTGYAGAFSSHVADPRVHPLPLGSATGTVIGSAGSAVTLWISGFHWISWSVHPIGTACTLDAPVAIATIPIVAAPTTTTTPLTPLLSVVPPAPATGAPATTGPATTAPATTVPGATTSTVPTTSGPPPGWHSSPTTEAGVARPMPLIVTGGSGGFAAAPAATPIRGASRYAG